LLSPGKSSRKRRSGQLSEVAQVYLTPLSGNFDIFPPLIAS
jgi:hypothetical protein